jgi:Family of unknown function (DUF6011)
MSSDTTGMALARKAAETAAGKQHRLAAFMVDGKHPLTQAAFDGIMRSLARCEDKEGAVTQPTGADSYFAGRAAASPEYRKALEAAREQATRPVTAASRLKFEEIPAGFYATDSAGANDLDFWKVTVSAKTGCRRARRVLGGGTTQQPKTVEISQQQQINALRVILRAGIEEASLRYAQAEDRCRDCGRQLTDENSRRIGKGNWCAEKNGI